MIIAITKNNKNDHRSGGAVEEEDNMICDKAYDKTEKEKLSAVQYQC